MHEDKGSLIFNPKGKYFIIFVKKIGVANFKHLRVGYGTLWVRHMSDKFRGKKLWFKAFLGIL